MVAIGRSSHAFFFDGVSDSIIIPQGRFTDVGQDTPEGVKISQPILGKTPHSTGDYTTVNRKQDGSFSIEAWIIPDCGGIVAHREGQFTLSVGDVDTPGPAKFTVVVEGETGKEGLVLSTAIEVVGRYEGTVYPTQEVGGIHDSYNRFDLGNLAEATDLNKTHRPLMHIYAGVSKEDAFLFVNGQMMAKSKLPENGRIVRSTEHIYIGGKGGEFRGTMESIHFSSRFAAQNSQSIAPLVNENTTGLYRFEEPLDFVKDTYDVNAFTALADGTTTTITIDTADAQTLISKLTGKAYDALLPTVDFLSSPFSMGSYEVLDYVTTPGTANKMNVKHTPYNLLINPGSINPLTKKPNLSPPERVRLHSIDGSTGNLVVSSIHVDFTIVSPFGNALRGLLHSRTTDIDNTFVVIGADLLIDNGTGKPYQPPHYGSQVFDRTGQMVLDESNMTNHGLIFSSNMATTTNSPNNPFAVTWPATLDVLYQIGHSGRHTKSHIQGHEFLKMLPRTLQTNVDQSIDGSADVTELIYDSTAQGIEKMLPINSRLDIFSEQLKTSVVSVLNSTKVDTLVNNGLPVAKREMIALGKTAMDYRPFLLKGPAPEFGTIDTETRRYHLRPEKTSRVALLKVPTLQTTHNLAPYVEIHYNAIDLTGASMSQTMPMLMVEKTVPKGSDIISGGTRFLDVILADLADPTKDTTLYAPGGIIELSSTGQSSSEVLQTEHGLLGDNTGGLEDDDELDESLTPVNYTPPNDATAAPNSPPTTIPASHVSNSNHESVYHKLLIDAGVSNSVNQLTLNEADEFSLAPASTKSGTGVFDIGVTSGNSIVYEMFDIIDNRIVQDSDKVGARLFLQPSDRTRTNQLSKIRTQETFREEPNVISLLFLMSKTKLRSVSTEESNDGTKRVIARAEGIVSTANSKNINESGSGSPDSVVVKEIEPNSPVVTVTLGGPGQGAVNTKPTWDPSPLARLPWSTQRPCVVQSNQAKTNPQNSVTTLTITVGGTGYVDATAVPLSGGTGQNARVDITTAAGVVISATIVNGGSDYTVGDTLTITGGNADAQVRVDTINSTTGMWMSVSPLNNNSPDIASWGTYCFPQKGRIYLPDGANAEYVGKVSAGFEFDDSNALAQGKYLLSDNTPIDTFHNWCLSNSLFTGSARTADISTIIYNNLDFDDANLCQDGSTINDRLFQTMDTVQHDYQLGSQYASTRALVEIPLFPQQFFEDRSLGIFPGPDNSMKIRLDSTYTAHTWNPTPVGRRCNDVAVADRNANSAFSNSIEEGKHVKSAHITTAPYLNGTSTHYNIHVSEATIFPPCDLSQTQHLNFDGLMRYRRAFLGNGSWVLYDNDPTTTGILTVPNSADSYSESFFEQVEVGMSLFVSGGYQSETLVPIASDDTTPSSDFEGRSAYHYDTANVQTQGGNLDYGLRQYVSAVEFAAGPKANPHAPRIKPGRAKAKITHSEPITTGSPASYTGKVLVTVSDEDTKLFPDVKYNISAGVLNLTIGDPLYTATITENDGTVRKFYFLGYTELTNVTDTKENTFVLMTEHLTGGAPFATPSYLNNLEGLELVLTKKGRAVHNITNPAISIDGENTASTFRPSTNIWKFPLGHGSGTTVLDVSNTVTYKFLHADSKGLAIRKGDDVFVENSATADIQYLGEVSKVESHLITGGNTQITLTAGSLVAVGGDDILRVGVGTVFETEEEGILNVTWTHPYAPGGLRKGDTIWMNMTMNNPHATEGLFGKSRGVLNEALVWKGFNGGQGQLAALRPRESIPLENFLIGETCLETAINFAQHLNKTIELNYESMGLLATQAPTIAYVDPYQSTDENARVLLYDVAHDREFIAFHDIHMQVQTKAREAYIGQPRILGSVAGTIDASLGMLSINGGNPHYLSTQIDVANGFPSENRWLRSTQQSKFIESAYSHDIADNTSRDLVVEQGQTKDFWTTENPIEPTANFTTNEDLYGKAHGHVVQAGLRYEESSDTRSVSDSGQARTEQGSCIPYWADTYHISSRKEKNIHLQPIIRTFRRHRESFGSGYTFKDPSTLFDTPDGTRCISAFLALKGIRSIELDLSNHEESRLDKLPHWTKMDFIRRLSIDLGEVGVKEGVTDIEAAAREVVRLINQAGAKNGRTHARRPSQQYPGESEKLDLTRVGVRQDIADPNKDPTAPHINADFAATGSTYDPAPWWDLETGHTSHDRGSHMGYLRAHIGRVVEDLDGNEGYSIIIHSTVPGASGRNFCAWLDNSKGQTTYKPQFLIGHGGRFRNFWCQPDEILGENMHPAPLPLNKHGRPFAPITTLREYIGTETPDEPFLSNSDYVSRGDSTSEVKQRVLSATTGSGMSANTINSESFEVQSPSSTLVEGLRPGTNAIGRINFGGLVESGVPGFAPDTGKWGFGKPGDKRFEGYYGARTDLGGNLVSIPNYTAHVPAGEIKSSDIGDGSLYGFRFVDHRGRGHGVRYIYRKVGEKFANENTVLPSTLDEEICVYFNDQDVGQGGFTIGTTMYGVGDVTGRMDVTSFPTAKEKTWRGNQWRGVPSPNMGIDSIVNYDSTAKTLTVTFHAPYDSSSTSLNQPDLLGYLGFPLDGGSIQISDALADSASVTFGERGHVYTYTSRTKKDTSGTHTFYGVNGSSFTATHRTATIVDLNTVGVPANNFGTSGTDGNVRCIITPRLNWTCLITDELLAAVTAFSINLRNVNSEEGINFDCRDLRAADGRTFGEWGVAEDAIIIKPHNPSRKVAPLSDMFEATLHKDWGIQSAQIEYGEYSNLKTVLSTWTIVATGSSNQPLSDNSIDKSARKDVGYIPKTIIQIKTKGRGYHTNTPTPVLVDSFNDPVDITRWRQNLKGSKFTSSSGDHILPLINNLNLTLDMALAVPASNKVTLKTGGFFAPQRLFHVLKPASLHTGAITDTSGGTKVKTSSFGEIHLMWYGSEGKAVLESVEGANSKVELKWDSASANDKWNETVGANPIVLTEAIISPHGGEDETSQFDGLRYFGSPESEPLIFFRGGHDSIDHSVPLYFGGGFSGVVLDINDGTQNDYGDFYTHPYSRGPTGCSGIQHANEISTSHAIIDCNALLSFFPGTALVDQHRGSISKPMNNRNSILSSDISGGTTTFHPSHPFSTKYTNGIVVQKPSPLVLRFAHPTARYEDHTNNVNNKTTFIIYGPGQPCPSMEDMNNADTEPDPAFVVTSGNTWSKVPSTVFLPNEIVNDAGDEGPFTQAYQTANHRFHWRTTINWEPAKGIPNVGDAGVGGLNQRPSSGRMYGEMFTLPTASAVNAASQLLYKRAHPLRHSVYPWYGVAISGDLCFHMDGGYAPGGSWLDNQITFNPPNPNSGYRVTKNAWNTVNPTAFRVSSALATKVLDGTGTVLNADVDMEYIVVDATRAQNGEELASVVGQAINEFPGGGALKALGGTFAPSMGNGMRQDRYGWVELNWMNYSAAGDVPTTSSPPPPPLNLLNSQVYVEAMLSGGNQDLNEQLPQCGWIRTDAGGRDPVLGAIPSNPVPMFAPYHSREVYFTGGNWVVRFWLSPNRISGFPLLEDMRTFDDLGNAASLTYPNGMDETLDPATKVYVWSKAGVHRYNNENASNRDYMTQVHFSGLIDAVDRTRPVGASGWAGERYSYLNSLKVGTEGYAAGLGAWHSDLGFSPYGSSSSCMNVLGHLPSISPMIGSPESSPRTDGDKNNDLNVSAIYNWNIDTTQAQYATIVYSTVPTGYLYAQQHDSTYYSKSSHYDTTVDLPSNLYHPQGVFSRAYVVVSYESELALVAKKDRDGITATGDWLAVVSKTDEGVGATAAIKFAGTVRWDERVHDSSRFTAPATAGPNVEALIMQGTAPPTVANVNDPQATFPTNYVLHPPPVNDSEIFNAEPCFAMTGDLFFDADKSPGSLNVEQGTSIERNLSHVEGDITALGDRYGTGTAANAYWMGDVNGYDTHKNAPAKNFSVEHVVWKRMDGGNLSLPAANVRGLGSVPLVTRVDGANSYITGESLFGNCRFTFETTNSAMYPIIQAQELSHPQLAARHPDELRNILAIPNEEKQFLDEAVEDDTGQIHTLIGGSPFGTIIRAFRTLSDRTAEGLAPASAGSGIEPNLKVRLPDPNSIPGNIIVRPGFDRLQGYQTETMGSGGMLHPGLDGSTLGHLFDGSVSNPRLGPTFGNHNWEHISQDSEGVAFPDSTQNGWKGATANNPLQTSYELHDRTLFFHITKSGHTHTHRYPTSYSHGNGVVNNDLTGVSYSGTTLTVDTAVDTSVFSTGFGEQEVAVLSGDPSGRRFLRLYNPTTNRGGIASYTGISGSTFTGCIGDAIFNDLVKSSITSLKIVPSYYIPAGSTRFFASRRLRDHSEVSGASPDMAHTVYIDGVTPTDFAHTVYSKPTLTPMPVPRMGHHFVTPTMPMLPGHWAHPSYQGLYDLHYACRSSTKPINESSLMGDLSKELPKAGIGAETTAKFNGLNPLLHFGALTASPSGPSDIHGGAFTLMFETKLRADGYGILASKGEAGVINSLGGHSVVLEGAANYTLNDHFPDPSEVGAYQIVIQPNIHKSQFIGFHSNGPTAGLPDGSAEELTNQQIALVVGIKTDYSVKGGLTLVLAEATMSDVRGCEVFINEAMIDLDPDFGSQFANIPPLLLYNSFGVQGTEGPSFTRQSFPYHPGMFSNATPGFSTNIPWWSIIHTQGPDTTAAVGFRHLSQLRFDNYYEFMRASNGAIACQITLAGYPSLYSDIYSSVLDNVSLNPKCNVIAIDKTGVAAWNPSAGTHRPRAAVQVDNAMAFLEVPYYGQKLEYRDAEGITQTKTYETRLGLSQGDLNKPTVFFIGDVVVGTDVWWDNLTVASTLRLSRAYNFQPAGSIFTDSKKSIITRVLPQTLQGSRDTNSLHMGDAFLCLWHPNLGRPHTFYSEGGRTWLNPVTDRAIAAKPYNSMPEHFETIHYHDVNYQASLGPFALQIKSPLPPTDSERTVTSISIATGAGGTGQSVRVVTGGTGLISQFSEGQFITANGKPLGIVDFVTGSTIVLKGERVLNIPVGAKIYIGGTGSLGTADDIDNVTGFNHQGGQYGAGATTKVMYNKFWPCGSRGGPLISRLDGFAETSTSWITPRDYAFDGPVWKDLDDDGSYAVVNGLGKDDYDDLGGQTRTRPFGYRYGLRQPYNRPQWSLQGARGFIETEKATGLSLFTLTTPGTGYAVATNVATTSSGSGTGCTVDIVTVAAGAITELVINTPGTGYVALEVLTVTGGGNDATFTVPAKEMNTTSGYYFGGLTQHETQTWTYKGAGTGAGDINKTYPNTYAGIMERHTNFSGMLGVDKPEWQVRYNDGRRMARPFGCPVRTLRNLPTVPRDWWGEGEGKGSSTIDQIVGFYIVDWWGNTRGEDIRRFPVRGFGIRPAWDSGNAYEYDRTNNKTPWERILNNGKPIFNTKNVVTTGTEVVSVAGGFTLPRFAGNLNNDNNNTTNKLVDVFAPTHSMRVGDMGNGRGVRYPTQFNEDILTALDEPVHVSGLVLSDNTAEPPVSNGFIRARNDILQNDEVRRGISSKLKIDEDGLIKPEAVVSDRVEDIIGDTPHKDAISRSSPRIGIDADNIEDIDTNLIVLNTEAHSLHTDRNVGQRLILHGGMTGGNATLGHYDLTTMDFGAQPVGGVMRFSHTNPFAVTGGSYILESRNYLGFFNDKDWGGGTTSSNPYTTTTFVSSVQTNYSDKSIKFLVRPVRMLDSKHIEIFRTNNALHATSPQFGSNAFSATGGGKYGVFSYEVPGGRASAGSYMRATNPDTNPPYAPVYYVDPSVSTTVPQSHGPKLLGTEVTGFDKTTLGSSVSRLIVTENTLQHHRSDASRRRTADESDDIEKRMDYKIEPRFSQSLHPKGHKGDVSFNSKNHGGDGS